MMDGTLLVVDVPVPGELRQINTRVPGEQFGDRREAAVELLHIRVHLDAIARGHHPEDGAAEVTVQWDMHLTTTGRKLVAAPIRSRGLAGEVPASPRALEILLRLPRRRRNRNESPRTGAANPS
jgi:hypothetical protein